MGADNDNGEGHAPRKDLPAAAQRALAEAAARHRTRNAQLPPAREIDGRGGAEPVRYGDWEVRGLASDF